MAPTSTRSSSSPFLTHLLLLFRATHPTTPPHPAHSPTHLPPRFCPRSAGEWGPTWPLVERLAPLMDSAGVRHPTTHPPTRPPHPPHPTTQPPTHSTRALSLTPCPDQPRPLSPGSVAAPCDSEISPRSVPQQPDIQPLSGPFHQTAEMPIAANHGRACLRTPGSFHAQVALYVSGCDHLMQHFKPVPSWTNVDYVVTGSGAESRNSPRQATTRVG